MIGTVSYANFYVGSLTVAGALVGLLFVSLSVDQGRSQSAPTTERQAVAATAFTALVDSLWICLAALLPGTSPGSDIPTAGVILGLLGVTSTAGLTYRLWHARSGEKFRHRWPIALPLIIALYGAQLVTSLTEHTGRAALSNGTTFVMVFFAIGIIRAWELLGMRGGGLFDLLTDWGAQARQARLVARENAAQTAEAPAGKDTSPG